MTNQQQELIDRAEEAKLALREYHYYGPASVIDDLIAEIHRLEAVLGDFALLMQAKARMNDGQEPVEVDLEDEEDAKYYSKDWKTQMIQDQGLPDQGLEDE